MSLISIPVDFDVESYAFPAAEHAALIVAIRADNLGVGVLQMRKRSRRFWYHQLKIGEWLG